MTNYKKLSFQALFILAISISILSCTNNKPEDSKDVAEQTNDAKFDRESNEKDAEFLVDAAEISMEEINLGKLAQTKDVMNRVKELGKMMEQDHTKTLASLTQLAQNKVVTLPASQTDDAIAAYEKLNKKTGNDFGKAYSDMMVEGHKDAIALFEKASTDCTDNDIRNWALEALPGLRRHLESAMISQKESNKM